jgi:hypothetical protein
MHVPFPAEALPVALPRLVVDHGRERSALPSRAPGGPAIRGLRTVRTSSTVSRGTPSSR